MIYTKRHEVLDLMRTTQPHPGNEDIVKMVNEIFENETLPHYVLTEDLLKSLDSAAVEATCTAMAQADVARLPHVDMLVETRVGKNAEFVLFTRLHGKDYGLLLTYDGTHFECVPCAVELEMKPDGMIVMNGNAPREVKDRIGAIYIVAVVLSHTRGLAKEVVTSDGMRKFNKCRAEKKRAPVMDHVVLRVGRVYNRNGAAQRYDGNGTMRRPHLRKGHARKQKYGPNWSLERWIFVPAAFINWTEGDDVPAFKAKVVTP